MKTRLMIPVPSEMIVTRDEAAMVLEMRLKRLLMSPNQPDYDKAMEDLINDLIGFKSKFMKYTDVGTGSPSIWGGQSGATVNPLGIKTTTSPLTATFDSMEGGYNTIH